MLTHLQLRDLVIVDEAELELGPGLSSLTGETGAGKSIIVDALQLISGGRASGDVVRQGAERAEIAANFATLPDTAIAWLEAQSIDHDGEVLVRRVIGADGRSRAYVNGQLVPIQALKELSEFLLEIHGQQEFLRLIQRGAQRALLDQHLTDHALHGTVSALYERYRTCERDHAALLAAQQNRDARLDLLRYQAAELQAEVTDTAAIEELFLEQKRVSGRGRLSAAARDALLAIYDADTDSAHDLLAKAQGALRTAGDDPQLTQAAQQLAEASILTQEAASALRHYLEALDVDPARQEEIERRAAALESLARKHRIPVLDLPLQKARSETELAALENAGQSLAEYARQLADLSSAYRMAAAKLTKARRKAAADLSAQISALMQTLGMAGGRFEVAVEVADNEFSSHGADDVEFRVSANPGQQPKSLGRVASGGELSRISLAIQVAAAAKTAAVCMVFDEVDAGIGGAVAQIVGRQLRELGSRVQVLCVTHLAQVASQAHSQFRVIKRTDGKTTRTAVKALNAGERVEEIARMLGGVDMSPEALAHARNMLTRVETNTQTVAPQDATQRLAIKKKRTKASPR